ncbi:RLA class II histocompatibility antigen, DP alpha-1 chain-like [Pimephales promelas]|uniref:RLA class II histocompatibility antigen, DP alpha-1 chain-like n=1 Tax=Pimephales promelas TaxID=90988 RepID=UPI001955AF62|nr:RLA class II histocompatibility antigen, DP alpha-1 chain-like [Pimephales promelas]KAG1974106.1 HLA class II histocompatibility antigen, DP alpha 1 chain [Pimephales promelas]
MELELALLTLTVLLSTDAQFIHNYFYITGCSGTEEESMLGSDGEEMWHADFIRKMGVNTLPDFADPMSFPGFYEASVAQQEVCKQNLDVCIKAYNNPPEEMDPPETSIYPQNDVEPGVENTLICHVTGFFPPPVNVSWTKNNVMVTEGVSLSQSRPRNDGLFHVFSSLKIIPEHRDIYSCTVNHRALQRPQTKIWGVGKASAVAPSVGPVLFCGLGMTLALLGMATGICFCIKATATDRSDLAKKEKKAMQWIYQ